MITMKRKRMSEEQLKIIKETKNDKPLYEKLSTERNELLDVIKNMTVEADILECQLKLKVNEMKKQVIEKMNEIKQIESDISNIDYSELKIMRENLGNLKEKSCISLEKYILKKYEMNEDSSEEEPEKKKQKNVTFEEPEKIFESEEDDSLDIDISNF
mgnify:CR=1 FL=1